jgi:hypothetical protein
MESERAATHDEIWDDSALVDSWNQALDEYKVSRWQQVSKPRPMRVTTSAKAASDTIAEVSQRPRQRRHSR